MPYITFWVITDSSEGEPAARGQEDADRHIIFGQRAGLVGRDYGGSAERFNVGKVMDDSVAAGHTPHTYGKDPCHQRWKNFSHLLHDERAAENEHVQKL